MKKLFLSLNSLASTVRRKDDDRKAFNPGAHQHLATVKYTKYTNQECSTNQKNKTRTIAPERNTKTSNFTPDSNLSKLSVLQENP